ncbi:polysaccharide pyruvyl transferase CsaB [Thermosediminibacter oceani]|uniref:Polysaccharide pyruvyl transferase CsaB n=1 Tax=Thermosediminibacter oceani (strain ATCC BAA-1034 / DSM 16646 / JW/IW-1228P) TaxID=555079 RepID=D9RYL7_THEOJ|nr:polysaccharide pyruvyl transferase CsaB [Thermosediminibacter oceani]ADL08441.1 polysaccharide pyruvyl transferase CsaB [Thermosediminibacter oceani DSM 16646]
MAEVVLSGYYGFDNLGDEAVLYAIVSALRHEAPQLKITVLSNNPKKTESLYGVKAVNRWKLSEVAGALKKADMLISGGGSLLQDVTSPLSLLYYLGVISLARTFKKKVFIYAQGFGPVNRAWARLLVRRVVQTVDYITLRDEESAEDLRYLGVSRPPVVVTADPVLGLDLSTVDKDRGIALLRQAGADLNRPLVGLALRCWKGEEVYLPAVAGLADRLIEEGALPVFIPFHHPEDLDAAKQAIQLMKRPEAVLLKRPLTVEEMLSVTGCLSMMVGMRLHSLIMAAACGRPVVGLSYDPKVDRFLRLIGAPPALKVEDINLNDLHILVRARLREGQTPQERSVMTNLKERALQSAKLAIRCLNQ